MIDLNEDHIELLRKEMDSRGVRLTEKQQKILKVMYLNKERYLNSQDIYAILKSNNEKIGIATVYRNLAWFKELCIVRGFSEKHGQMIYQLRNQSDHQFICTRCGLAKDLDISDLVNHPDIYVEDVQIFGLCTSCKKMEE